MIWVWYDHKFVSTEQGPVITPNINPSCPKVLMYTFLFEFGRVFITLQQFWWILVAADRTKCMIRVWHHKFMLMWDIAVAPLHINPSCPKVLIYTFLFEFGRVFITLQQFWWILVAADRTKCMIRVWHHKIMSMWDWRVAPPLHINPSCPKVLILSFLSSEVHSSHCWCAPPANCQIISWASVTFNHARV